MRFFFGKSGVVAAGRFFFGAFGRVAATLGNNGGGVDHVSSCEGSINIWKDPYTIERLDPNSSFDQLLWEGTRDKTASDRKAVIRSLKAIPTERVRIEE